MERRDPSPVLPPPPVGRVVATEQKPATPHQFHFWTATETSIGIGAIVRVEGSGGGAQVSGRVVYGVVTDAFAYSDLVTPLHDVVGAEGDPARAAENPTARQEIRLWTAAVLRQIPAEPLQPVPLGDVHVATDADVAQALRMDAYLGRGGAQPTAIPVGLYTSGGLEAPVYLDADFLLGPEAAHLNISGVSGLATKTSAVEFLLSSIFQHFPAHRGRVAAVCFNVKGPDLCFLDRPGTLDDEDRRRYERLGVGAHPFERVCYYAPFKADGVNLNTLRTHPDLVGDVEPLVWGLREVLDYAEVLLNRDDIDAKADAFIDFLSDRVVDREFDDGFGGAHRVVTFADLERLFRSIFDGLELASRSDTWRTHHIATIRKVRNRLSNISTRCKGLVADDGPSNDLPWGRFEDRAVYVVDVANVDPLGQDLVFARVVSKLREHLERRDLGVEAVVVFVDELNKYAPGDGPETYVKKMLLDISERGRYLGLVLFGAEQFRSQVHRRVVGNAGTIVFGRMDSDELATPGYQVLSPATKIKLATLPVGELMVRHPHFTQPIFVRFPRPAALRGRDGVERFPPAADLSFDEAVVRQLVKLDRRVRPNAVKDLIADRREEDVRRALAHTRQARPQDAFANFKKELGRRVAPAMAPGSPLERQSVPPLSPISDEPY
ncbi:MAG: ATP-binding protein [Gemmatimonadetes bacterium]|nr:MAG: ATP-binding protein [Gemmatimonadota bacterium]